jgi:iron(III) transport system ATP-binding protein
VIENICFGIRHLTKDEQNQTAQKLLQLIGLSHKKHAYPHELSGGQHQRIALARSLAPKPQLMLLDEPFANLDNHLRREIREDVIGLLRDANIPIIMVTHDPEEALIMADSMVLLGTHGKVHQSGTPDSLHNHPKDIEAARFFGHINLFKGKIDGDIIRSKLGNLPREPYATTLPNHADILVATRPEGIRIATEDEPCVRVSVERIAHTGAGWLITALTPEGEKLQFHHIYGARPQKGDSVCVTYEQPHIFIFAANPA